VRFLADNSGQIRVIEAFFAALLLLSSLTLIRSETGVQSSSDENLRLAARNTLIALDNDGVLAKLVENESWVTLRKCVESLLSPATWFNLTVFDENMNPVNQIQISNGSPINPTIVTAEYVCTSSSRDYRIYFVRLQLSNVN
jgi:hypothetical protein